MFLRRNKQKEKKELKLKIDRSEEVQEGEIVETEWDIKKLIIGFIFLVLLIIIGSYIFFPSSEVKQETLGVSAQNLTPTPPLPDQEDIQNVINNAQETLSQITAKNLTSSEAAIQRVINDLEMLKGNNGALNLFCNTICKK